MIGQGVWILWGSKIALSHWQSQSPLTQGWRYRAARDGCHESNTAGEHSRTRQWLSECVYRVRAANSPGLTQSLKVSDSNLRASGLMLKYPSKTRAYCSKKNYGSNFPFSFAAAVKWYKPCQIQFRLLCHSHSAVTQPVTVTNKQTIACFLMTAVDAI